MFSWPQAALPNGWTARLVDREAGTETVLAPGGSCSFGLAGPVGEAERASERTRPGSPVGGLAEASAESGPARFALVVTPAGVTVSGEDGVTYATAPEPPRPNPTAERASLALTLAEAGPVRAEVFDALGRRVALLADEPLAAGRHEIQVDANRLPPGTYVVREVAGGEPMTRRLTVVRWARQDSPLDSWWKEEEGQASRGVCLLRAGLAVSGSRREIRPRREAPPVSRDVAVLI